jgi:hypothetical protein
MAAMRVVFFHGWSVSNTDTYGELPARLKRDAVQLRGIELDIAHICLGQYISFRDEVRLADVSRALESALAGVLGEGRPRQRLVCITHSTGGPVVRDWLDRYYVQRDRIAECPLSHLIMLAPANFGSALAQIGKSRLGAMKAWFNGVEPGQGILDWLELGSPESCALNLRWINEYAALDLTNGRNAIFPFVLSGESIDRKLYDHVNSYTGETGSDGVVRLAAANLNASHVVLEQAAPVIGEALPAARKRARQLNIVSHTRAPKTAFKIVPGVSHSGSAMGIMRSVRNNAHPHPTVDAILRCLGVVSPVAYADLCAQFDRENQIQQDVEHRLEIEKVPVLPDRQHIHDPHAMLIFRMFDTLGTCANDLNLLLTAGSRNDPNQLPSGFLRDRQGNRRSGFLSFYLNYSVLAGCDPIPGKTTGRIARPALIPNPPYGLRVIPREENRLVEYWACELDNRAYDLLSLIRPNETTIIDIQLNRIVRERVMRFTTQMTPRDFREGDAGPPI